jgi:hypothetical protein
MDCKTWKVISVQSFALQVRKQSQRSNDFLSPMASQRQFFFFFLGQVLLCCPVWFWTCRFKWSSASASWVGGTTAAHTLHLAGGKFFRWRNVSNEFLLGPLMSGSYPWATVNPEDESPSWPRGGAVCSNFHFLTGGDSKKAGNKLGTGGSHL